MEKIAFPPDFLAIQGRRQDGARLDYFLFCFGVCVVVGEGGGERGGGELFMNITNGILKTFKNRLKTNFLVSVCWSLKPN